MGCVWFYIKEPEERNMKKRAEHSRLLGRRGGERSSTVSGDRKKKLRIEYFLLCMFCENGTTQKTS